jgi:GH35 family endo-1,4-beta-xylanase
MPGPAPAPLPAPSPAATNGQSPVPKTPPVAGSWLDIIGAKDIIIGTAVSNAEQIGDAKYEEILRTNFNQVVAEWADKWSHTNPEKGVHKLDPQGIALYDYAVKENKVYKFHAFSWYIAIEQPKFSISLAPMDRLKAIVDHTTSMMKLLSDKKIWKYDVVNEAITDSPPHELRGYWKDMGGVQAMVDVFLAARKSSPPGAILIYNDYATSPVNGKSDYMFQLFKDMRAIDPDSVPDEVGLQYHENAAVMDDAWFDSFKKNMMRFYQEFKPKNNPNGMRVNLSEVDIRTNQLENKDPAEKLKIVAELYYKTFKVALSDLTVCNNVCIWNFDDTHSWIYKPEGNEWMREAWGGFPDQKKDPGAVPWANYMPHPAVQSISTALKEIVAGK